MASTKKSSSVIDKRDLRNIFNIFRKNWYVFFIFIVPAYFLAYNVIHKSTYYYQATASVLLKSNSEGSFQETLLKGLGINPTYENTSSEMRVVNSSPIVERTFRMHEKREAVFKNLRFNGLWLPL